MTIESIAVIGAGQMGNGIAQVAALSGYNVVMIDVKDDFIQRGMDTINFSLSKLASKEKITQEEADLALAVLKPQPICRVLQMLTLWWKPFLKFQNLRLSFKFRPNM